MNKKRLGSIAVAKAIAWFTENGYNVSVPVAEVQRYDLVVEKDGILYRVEVKSSVNRKVGLRTNSPNYRVRNNHKSLTTEDAEMLFVVNVFGMYLIPVSSISGKQEIMPDLYASLV